jgi:3-hydroxyisobutyrate dehydrogenase-like beta-hydroxyacid dehydrogenase
MLTARIPKILGDDASVGFDIHGAIKDAGLFVDAAHRLNLEVPALAVARDAWSRSLDANQGKLDIAALISLAYNEA